jgi:MFS family permease
MSTAGVSQAHGWANRSWRDRTVRFAVGLAFADASIVVLALPQIVDELDTTISHVTWVIMAYNIALIIGVLGFLAAARRLTSRGTLLAGLALFGLASIGCGTAHNLELLVIMRCVQGLGGALLLCATLPLLAGVARPGDSPTAEWAAAAAIGAAIGPAAGGLLTQLFDWRAIFLAQAPAAAVAIAAVLAAPHHSFRPILEETGPRKPIDRGFANLALLLLSAALIGALFLVVVMLIEVWRLEPIEAAAIVSAIPVTTLVVERVTRGRSSVMLAALGAVLLAAGLAIIAFLSHRQVPLAVLALALCGTGLGLAFTTLSDAAMGGSGSTTVRAGVTSAAREAGLILGLVVLTPLFVADLNKARDEVTVPIAQEIAKSPVPGPAKSQIITGLLKISDDLPEGSLPDLGPAFDPVHARAPTPQAAAQVSELEDQTYAAIERKVTRSFRRSFLYCAGFAVLVLPVLGIAVLVADPRRRRGAAASAQASS